MIKVFGAGRACSVLCEKACSRQKNQKQAAHLFTSGGLAVVAECIRLRYLSVRPATAESHDAMGIHDVFVN
jgi:hypothetical protein